MAFADQGELGTANSKVSGTTITMTTTADAPVGRLVVVMAAWDNSDSSSIDGLRHYITDSAGNFYTYLGQFVSAGGVAGGAEAMIYASVVETDLPAGGTITCTSLTARVAKAITARQFSLGSSWFCLTDKSELSSFAADPGSLTLSGMPSREYLFLHALAAKGPNTDAYTWDSDYTQVTGDGTTGGTDATNQHVRGGYRIATLTGDTVDVASTTADRTYAQVFVAIREYTPTAAPSAALLDDFNRANETPLASPYSAVDSAGLKLISNAVGVQAGSATPRGSLRSGFGADQEMFATVGVDVTTAGNQIGVGAHFSNTGTTAWNGYTITSEPRAGIPDSLRLQYTVSGNVGALTTAKMAYQYVEISAGDVIGIRTLGTVVEGWFKTGGTWRMFAAVDDSTSRSGSVGLIIQDSGTASRLDDLHAATLVTTGIKTIEGVSWPSSVKTLEALAQASVKTVEGLA